MGKIGLQIKATLSNIDKVYPHRPDEFEWAVKVRCTGCGEENENWHLISADEVVEMTHTKANFYQKCKFCSRENHLSILNEVPAKKAKREDTVCKEYTSEDDGQYRTLVAFDCRGMELSAFEPRDGWAAVSGSKVFTEVDLSDKEGWADYNDIDNIPVEITDVGYRFTNIK